MPCTVLLYSSANATHQPHANARTSPRPDAATQVNPYLIHPLAYGPSAPGGAVPPFIPCIPPKLLLLAATTTNHETSHNRGTEGAVQHHLPLATRLLQLSCPHYTCHALAHGRFT